MMERKKIHDDINTCPMWNYIMAIQGEVQYLIKDDATVTNQELEEAVNKLTEDYVAFRKTEQAGSIQKLLFEVDVSQRQLHLYEHCIALLINMDSDELKEILHDCPYVKKITADYQSAEYYEQLKRAYNDLERFRLTIRKKQDKIDALIKAQEKQSDSVNQSDNYLKMIDSISMWRQTNIDAYGITMKQYAIMEERFEEHIKSEEARKRKHK